VDIRPSFVREHACCTTARNRRQVRIGTPTRQHEPTAARTSRTRVPRRMTDATTTKPFERKWSAEQQHAIAHAMLDAKPTAHRERASAAGSRHAPRRRRAARTIRPVPISTCITSPARTPRPRSPGRGRLAKAGSAPTPRPSSYADAWSELDRAREDVRRAKMSGAERAKALREIVPHSPDHRPSRARPHRRSRAKQPSTDRTRDKRSGNAPKPTT
jgi:hypothetical protein